jgi:MGT family glycosyltransferase
MIWLNWSGGGNLPPSLGIARVLSDRGHRVSFAGRPEMVPRVARAGFQAIELKRAYEQADRCPKDKWLPRAASFLTSPAVAEEIATLLASESPDLVIIDQMFPVALLEAARFGQPSVAVCHTTVFRALEMWRKFFAMLTQLRSEAGFAPISGKLEDLWMVQDKMIATTLSALDTAPQGAALRHAEKLRHVGPVLEREPHAVTVDLPWPDDHAAPFVVVSFSTAPEQGSVQKFQNAIDALAAMPVRGIVTTGDSIESEALRPAKNVAVFGTANHDALMRRADMVVTHGGHGTLVRALQNGLPVVVISGLGGDQPINAKAVEDWNVGRALPGEANADLMRKAIAEVLGNSAYRERAAALSEKFFGGNGARNAADEIEAMLPACHARGVQDWVPLVPR